MSEKREQIKNNFIVNLLVVNIYVAYQPICAAPDELFEIDAL